MRLTPPEAEANLALEPPPESKAIAHLMDALQALSHRFDLPVDAVALGLAITIDRITAVEELRQRYDVRRRPEHPPPHRDG